ncbi:hypothetical protein [Streptomyces gobiensis]|uniref:hypothetical protein n=1 Tax=Streptomyces gobiensis TaxID=2875706 RepID=UPI001E4844E3|nr:hypothetical protein [Streptomyces gobiensis]UGY90562.1 hypothetical protein test1122_01685 [Streptomyces gobiensis]
MTNLRRPNLRLRALLSEADWTQEALARAVNCLGAEIGTDLRYDRTAVAHWLAGTQPRRPVPQLIAEALSRRIGRAVTPQAAGFRAAPVDPPSRDPVTGFTTLCRSDSDPARRVPLQQRPYRVADAAVPALPPALRPSRAHPPPGRTRPQSRQTLALHDAARFFAASIDAHGGRNARSALAAYLADDVSPLLHQPRAAPEQRELLIAASRLSFLLARMYEDGLLHGLAQHYYTYAHRLAHESGDRAAWAVVVRAMSAQAQRLGHLTAARNLAEAAAVAVATAPPAPRSYVYAQLAVARARTGDRRGSLEAMTAAERYAGRTADAAGPFDTYPAAALSYQTSAALEALGDLPAALAALRRSVIERPAADLRGRALTQARFGHLLLGAGRLDEACAAWRGFLDGYGLLRSGDAERALQEIRRALRPYRNRQTAAELLHRSLPRTVPSTL